MTKEELIKKLGELEWEDFEVKTAKGGLPKSSWETVSAFANTFGGWILFGISQVGKIFEIQGLLNPEQMEQDFLNTIRGGKFNAFISTKQQKFKLENKTILGFYVLPSKYKPIYFNNPKNTFIRRGSADHRATNIEIDAMFRDQSYGTKTNEQVEKTNRSDINDTSLQQYRSYMSRFNPNVSYNRYTDDEFLDKLRVIEDGKCTYGGLLFMGKRESIERHFPDFRIDLLEIPGTSIRDAEISYTFRLGEYENLWDYYFACFNRLKAKVDVEFTLTNEGFGQELSPGLTAIREALVNMLMHADYFSLAKSRIRIFDNHIEFYNPGGLPKPFEEIKSKDLSLPRNPIIAKLFRMVRLAENAGYGFDKLEQAWLEYNGTIPEYMIEFDSVVSKFSVKEQKEIVGFNEVLLDINEALKENKLTIELLQGKLKYFKDFIKLKHPSLYSKLTDMNSETDWFIFMLIQINGELSLQNIGGILNVTRRVIDHKIKSYRDFGYIIRKGSTKTGLWLINKM
ncbi:MAG: RNA-binding domain-containing protein [Bacteroidales bacterium]|jgi:predicted HTH transcriptional regulator|nr:putative DNA binding domain-containing protein [Bacteroidales bacterium]MDY0370509.1 putative DNA binding domain-containing protein [Bacteroidales bacterium]